MEEKLLATKEILKKYGITKPTYYRYKENFGL